MSRLLADSLVERLLALTSSEKELAGSRIAEALGADTEKRATALPARRGTQDGGIDGRFRVRRTVRNVVSIRHHSTGEWLTHDVGTSEVREMLGGISVKLESKRLTRMALNSFAADLRREGLVAGLVVTARGLSADAEEEMQRHSRNGLPLEHIYVADIIAGNVQTEMIEFVVNPADALLSAIANTE